MRWFEILVLAVLFTFLFIGVYILWIKLPQQTMNFKAYRANISNEFPKTNSQFYSNMRYPDRTITYELSDACTKRKKEKFLEATKILEQKTILKFIEIKNAEIKVTCKNIAPPAKDKNHFIAGEGGPTEIINSTIYAIITSGQIALYRSESCPKPQISIHEILHAIGFNHNSNQNSIMYPITECDQTIDKEIIDTINLLYKNPSKGDLIIEKIIANKTGRYLNFKAIITNQGLKNIIDSKLNLIIDNKIIGEYNIGSLEIGAKKSLDTTNIKIPNNTKEITIEIKTDDDEISKKNNRAKISVINISN